MKVEYSFINHINKSFMKYVTYFVSFFAYVAVHILRMGYSSIKAKFEEEFQLDNVFMGIFDGLVYISLASGFFFRFYIEGNTSKTKIYLIFGIITAIAYSIIPVLGLILKNDHGTIGEQSPIFQYILPGFGLILFGFCQFTAWPVLLYFVSLYFPQGTLMGIWSANGDVGNIFGFFLGKLILDILQIRWEFVMLIGAGLHLFMSFTVFFVLKQKKDQNDMISSQQSLRSKDTSKLQSSRYQKWKQFLRFSKDIIRLSENKMYLISMGLLKSILYGFLLWMPTYLTHQGYKRESTYAPILFNVFTVFGSALLGYFYGHTKRVARSEYQVMSPCQRFLVILNKNIKSYSLFYSCMIISGCLVMFFLLPFELATVFILSSVTGFFLGGAFNMLASNEVVAITKGDQKKVDMLSTLSMVCGNLFVGVVEIIIGLALNVKENYDKQTNLFIVLLTICGLGSLIIVIRSTLIYRQRRKESILLQNEIDQAQAQAKA